MKRKILKNMITEELRYKLKAVIKKNVLLLLLCICFISSCKTYEDTVKIQEYVNLENYYENLKDKSQKDLNNIASKMRLQSFTFKNSIRLNKLLIDNDLKSKESSKRLWKQNKEQKNNFLVLKNNFEIELTQDFFKLIDNAKSFEEIESFLEAKKKLVLSSEQLTIKEKKRLLKAIASVDLGLDFILNNVDLLDFTHYEAKAKRGNRMTAQRCFRNRGGIYIKRCPIRLRLIGRVSTLKVCCRNISYSQATPYLPIIWGGALAEPTPVGEVIATIVTAGIGLYYLNLAKNRPHCIALYVKRCKSPLPCSTCLQFCLAQGVWDFHNCPIKKL